MASTDNLDLTESSTASEPQQQIPLISRELSWLAFNYRVLQEAKDPRVPLLERLNFMAIFSSNLDEYFKVRVATMRRLVQLKKKTREKLEDDPSQELEAILTEVSRQQEEFGHVYRNELLPELRKEQIYLIDETECTDGQRKMALDYFRRTVKPLLVPIIFSTNPSPLFLKDQTVYLMVRLLPKADQAPAQEQYAILEIPTHKHGSRFVQLPIEQGKHYVMLLDDVIRIGLAELFPGFAEVEAYAVKLSRDAELDIEEEVSGNLMAKIKKSLKKRETGHPSRLLFDPATPRPMLQALLDRIGITTEELVEGSRFHNFRDFFGFPKFKLPELYYAPQPPLPHPVLENAPSLLAAMKEQEFMVHYPYQKFDYVLRFFEEAASDPQVTSISVTLYRVADKSKVAKALIKAAEHGKLVTVVVELKARFDEESNIYWGNQLEKAGANVIYGVPDLKVHSKIGLVTRQENGQAVQYAYLSTGNYNEKTSLIYTDHALFTTDERLTNELTKVFHFLVDGERDLTFEHLLVAPFNLRSDLNALIQQEMKLAQEGKPAYLIAKMNALQDSRMIKQLYEASQAGVKIELLVRGICSLIPGVPGLSENITVRSIVDRYLEHGRIYVFGNGGEEKVYVASADWMNRNLSRRVEVGFPIYNPILRQEIRHLLDLHMRDTYKSRHSDNQYCLPEDPSNVVHAQYASYDYLKQMADQHEAEGPVEN
ncbi:polyphosphate kinase 1 [Rufibacter glacialis]|uniref:Polyphosphate kinase n=1 Tax=Rufibacter glacialis TaxID=1259555 RepID=A0A5M8Q551_9BACT|nr:polyphosphate kinase 1 [Rufibacter glacialis]KAA6430218.1 polyphosphate kinase 1 [Rufibacter glacialis]GGK87440.1 polyphosphate kinase [Rufibacter glacialis]